MLEKHISNTVKYIAHILNKKWVTSFKQLVNNPTALTKRIYINDVLPNIDNYYVTEKLDGIRSFILIKTNPYLIKILTSTEVQYINVNEPFEDEYIFDCEFLHSKVYIFDVIIYKGKNVANEPFKLRHSYLEEFDKIFNINRVIVKKFKKLSINNYQQYIADVYKYSKSLYPIDGLIFVEITKNYNNTINLKWKPPRQLTIDFLAIRASKSSHNRQEYILFTGISAKSLAQFNIKLKKQVNTIIENLKDLNITVGENYKPIPFYNSLIPNIFVYNSENLDLHGNIIELSINNGKWVFNKIRHDRNVELTGGTYYGNNYKVAELTLQSILNPLTFAELLSSRNILVKDLYFKKQDNTYEYVKKFNNYVKDLIINRYKVNENEAIIDLASGRGGDLFKYINAATKHLLMLEVDINAIDEALERKYNIFSKKNVVNMSCDITILNLDLNKNFKKNIKSIDDVFEDVDKFIDLPNNIYKKHSVPVIHCHFAMHYMLENITDAKNIISFIDHYLKPGGVFIMTIFDGQLVFDLLKKNKGIWKPNSKYNISKLKFPSSNFSGFGYKIKVLLPLSDIPYEESLIDLLAIDKLFKAHNIMRIEERSFADILSKNSTSDFDKFNNGSKLDNYDKQFISLYKYVIYKKIN